MVDEIMKIIKMWWHDLNHDREHFTRLLRFNDIEQKCFNNSPGPAAFPPFDLQTPFRRTCYWWMQDCCHSHPQELLGLAPLRHCWVDLSLLLQSFKKEEHVSSKWKYVFVYLWPVCKYVYPLDSCLTLNLDYLKCDVLSGLSVQSCWVLNSDRPFRTDGERSRFWKDPQCSHKSSLGKQIMEEITSKLLLHFVE